MSETKLEIIFKEKAESSGNYILHSQWITERREIIKALDAISIFFPHYSLHNASHSESIINNITRILGENNLKKMSAVDLWLILEAAYCHDLGMVVNAEDIEIALDHTKENNFIDFFANIKKDNTHSLHQYTKFFYLTNNKLCYEGIDVQHKIHDAFKFLLSEFFRQKHGTRVEEIIKSYSFLPPMKLGLVNQRNNIPHRLYGVLGQICSVHTTDFAKVLSLPFSESGMNTEDAHPRFIACLLRLGDVLDVDNLRFSDPSLMTLASIPSDTKTHIKKHAAITHLRIDRKSIEISADCNDPKVAHVTKQWFSWIQQEFDDQVTMWNNIVPHPDFGFLPTVDKLEVNLNNFIIPEQPAFTIDTAKALSLLSGTNIYDSWFDSIRELIQNAADSMLIRQWLKAKENDKEWNIVSLRKEAQERTSKQIDIEIKLKENADNEILFTIQDCGIGIDLEDLKFLSSPGNSINNTRKRKIVEEMPVELQPSGIFGIGFQSVFLLTDKVVIKTKSYFTDEQYEITMHSPTSSNKGDIYLETIPLSNERLEYGTSISFIFSQDIIKDDLNPDNVKFYKEYDMLSEKLNRELFSLQQTIFFNLIYNGFTPEKTKQWKYLPNSKIEVCKDEQGYLYYKGMKVSTPKANEYKEDNLIDSFVKNYRGFSFNIHNIQADAILNISRNTIKRKAHNILKEKLRSAIAEYINLSADDLDSSMSRFVHFYRKEDELDSSIVSNSKLQDLYKSQVSGNHYCLNDRVDFDFNSNRSQISPQSFFDPKSNLVVNLDEYTFLKKDTKSEDFIDVRSNRAKYSIKKDDNIVLILDDNYSSIEKDIFVFYLKEILINKECYLSDYITSEITITFDKENENDQITEDGKYKYQIATIKSSSNNISKNKFVDFSKHVFEFNSMFFLPVTNVFRELLLDKNYFKLMDNFYGFNDKYSFILSLDVMIIPYSATNRRIDAKFLNDSFYQWVKDHLKEKKASLERIKELYILLLETYK